MTYLKKTEINFDNTSYIDPKGRVFYYGDGIFRAFYPETSEFYRRLLDSEALKSLIGQGKVVDTAIETGMEAEGFGLVVRHRRIEFPSYCFEWPAAMLKDAALLTLHIARTFCKEGIALQDATPYNVLFDFQNPVFIDMGSFSPPDDKYLWPPYQQFCNFFLFPLYLYSSGASSVARKLLMDSTEGVSGLDVKSIFGMKDKLSAPGYFSRISIPEILMSIFKKTADRTKMSSLSESLGKRADLNKMRMKFLSGLYDDVGNCNIPKPGSHWAGYYEETKEDVLTEKKNAVSGILEELRPKTVLDIGCNLGIFSILAASLGCSVLSFDTDHDCVNRLYNIAKEKRLRILPIIMNILNPSPGTGWRCIQYRPAHERFKCDMAIALAVIHHLVFSGGQDFGRAIESIGDFHKRWLLIEYVDREDPMSRLLRCRPGLNYDWYTLENFLETLGSYYKDVRVLRRLSETRVLIICDGRIAA
jgi:SAM-dependent methyltransferase